ncbi:MAG: hypothetical protein ACT6FE_06535 [Methanosarcinaceae archaeon]
MSQYISSFLTELQVEIFKGLEECDTKSPLLRLEVTDIDLEIPIEIKLKETRVSSSYLTGKKSVAPKHFFVKPPEQPRHSGATGQFGRLKLKLVVKYNDKNYGN